MKDLKETVDLMLSSDYKERFVAEYQQLKIRYVKLLDMVHRWECSLLDFKPSCPITTYYKQLSYMRGYLDILEQRAEIENVKIRRP